jgi:cell division protein ZapE
MTKSALLASSGRPVALRYAAKVAAGEVNTNSVQLALVDRLDRLNHERSAVLPGHSLVSCIFGRLLPSPKGVYIHGAVGRGKTMLMDTFFAAAEMRAKRRIHFNAFMDDVQDRLHAVRQQGNADPIAAVARAIAAETRLLCLDEFSVTDIADAMILSRLFGRLFDRGLVLVATSNSAPEDLYKDGLNRGLFLPFVEVLRRRVDVFNLDIDTDYRLAKLVGAPVYVTPLGPGARTALDTIWRRLTGTPRGQLTALRTHGRDIGVPQAEDGVARFSFADLCEAPLAANDYLQIARAFHTLIVDDVPVIADDRRDVARRLILLVDTLYDHRVNLIVSAAAEPSSLYTASDGEEAFAFRRTASRLIEMRSASYLGAAHGASAGANPPLAPQHQSG